MALFSSSFDFSDIVNKYSPTGSLPSFGFNPSAPTSTAGLFSQTPTFQAANTTTRSSYGSPVDALTGGMGVSGLLSYQRPTSIGPGALKGQAYTDAWNNYMRAQSALDSLKPGSMGFGDVSRLPGESDDAYWSRRGTIEKQFNVGTGTGIQSALRNELGLPRMGSTKSSSGGFRGYTTGPSFAPTPINFSRGLPPEQPLSDLPLAEFTKRLAEVNQPEQLAALAERYNAPQRQAFESYLPEFRPSLAGLGGLARSLIAGNITPATSQQIARSSAATNFRTGLFGGGLGRGLTLRDFGLSSLAAQQAGADLLGKSVGLAEQAMRVTTPVSAASLMVNPQEVFQTVMNQAQANQTIAYQNLLNAWQSQPLPGQYVLGRGFQTYTPGVYSSTRPTLPG